jgi:hypothetical protein
MIKKTIFFIILSLYLNIIYSQKYQPVDSTTVWATEYVYKIDGTCYVQENGKSYIKGYVLNNGNKWLKIFYSKTSNWHPNSPSATCMNLSYTMPAQSLNQASGYLLNDSLNKKVYVKNSLPVNYTPTNADVLYDFNNKLVGDTLYVTGSVLPLKFKINTIDSVLFTGKYHKRFITAYTGSSIANTMYSFTEGIGSSIHPFSPGINAMGEQYRKLLCFASPTLSIAVSTHTVFANGTCANFVMNLSERNKFEFNIYPNPVSDKLSIVNVQFVPEKIDYELIDLVGQLKQKGELKENRNDIGLQNLSDGIYFINFYKEGSIISSTKIIVSR